jgi:cytoskeleton protein RodZ
MSETAISPGTRLRVERERQGLSLQKAADELHLDAWVIEALEADQFERVGPPVYAKGHLRKYASVLGLRTDELISAYEARAPQVVVAPTPPPALSGPIGAPPMAARLPRAKWAAAAGTLLLIIGIWAWKPWQQHAAVASSDSSADSQAAAPPVSDAVPSSSAAPALPTTEPMNSGGAAFNPGAAFNAGAAPPGTMVSGAASTPMPAATSSSAPMPAEAAVGGGHARLRMSFSADSWVEVRDPNGRRIYSGYGRANTVKVLVGRAPLRVYLGFASGVQLEINERAVAIGAKFVHGDVARFQAGADGVLRNDSHDARPRD